MKTASEIVTVLNNLIETNLDRIQGYEKALTDAGNPEVKDLCKSYASQSRDFKNQLEQLVKEYNGTPKVNGSAHRASLEVKHSITDSNKSALNSCETGEDTALEKYRHAKVDSLGFPARIVSTILNQNSEIVKARDQLRMFRNVLTEH